LRIGGVEGYVAIPVVVRNDRYGPLFDTLDNNDATRMAYFVVIYDDARGVEREGEAQTNGSE
jgi:hypothetical protein